MMKKRLLIVGSDSIGSSFLDVIRKNFSPQFFLDNSIYLDESADLQRIFRLIKYKRIRLNTLFRMTCAEIVRKWQNRVEFFHFPRVFGNQHLAEIIRSSKVLDEILLFRAGLIISKQVLAMNIPVFNIHCASIPRFGGIGVLAKALRLRAFKQVAVVHKVTARIDEGEVVMEVPYELSSQCTYFQNEALAYTAGIEVGLKFLKQMDVVPQSHGEWTGQ